MSHEHLVQFSPLYPGEHCEHLCPVNPTLHTQAPPLISQIPSEPTGSQSHGKQGSRAYNETFSGR